MNNFFQYQIPNFSSDLYDFLNDETQTEADIYIAFRKIMSLNQKDMFRSSVPENDDPVNCVYFPYLIST